MHGDHAIEKAAPIANDRGYPSLAKRKMPRLGVPNSYRTRGSKSTGLLSDRLVAIRCYRAYYFGGSSSFAEQL